MKSLQLGMYVNDVNMKKLENGQLCEKPKLDCCSRDSKLFGPTCKQISRVEPNTTHLIMNAFVVAFPNGDANC
jgi:hypothetical protein